MGFISEIFGSLLYLIYTFVGNYGIAIVVFTIVAKLLLLPINIKQTKSMSDTQKIQPELQKLQKKYANNKQKLNEETMKLYQEHNVNPMGGCLPLLLQFPIIIGLFTALREPAKYVFESEVAYQAIDKAFLWIPNIGSPDPLHILPVLAALTTYLYMSNTPSQSTGNDQTQQMNQSMKLISPLMIGFFAWTFPAGLAIYWVVQNLFTYVQQYIMLKRSAQEGVKGK